MRRLVLLSCALMLSCASQSPSKQAIFAPAEDVVAHSIDSSEPFAIVRVDDGVDPLTKIPDDQIPFGSGVGIFQENVPLGVHHFGVTHYARLIPHDHEIWTANASRFLAWAGPMSPVPQGERYGFEEVIDYDQDTKVTTVVGLRTVLLLGDSIITHHDVAEANVVEGDEDVPEISIALKLDKRGARKLQLATASWAFRRLAILSHGKVEAAPVVKAEIDDGELQIAIGPRSDAIVARAKKLAEEILQK